VQFDASGSSDPDGALSAYEWDWDGNDGWDWETGSADMAHTYDTAGSYTVYVRVRDADGALAFASQIVNVQVGNLPPTGKLVLRDDDFDQVIDTFEGRRIEAFANAEDSDGEIVSYDWDLDGDGFFEASTPYDRQGFRPTAPGAVTATVRVRDNDGGQTLVTTPLLVLEDAAPVAVLHASTLSGPAPLTVHFDATASFDPEPGSGIASVVWSYGYGPDSEFWHPTYGLDFTYIEAGSYTCRLTLTDLAGQQSVAEVVIEVTGGKSHRVNRLDYISSDQLRAALVDGYPAVVYDINRGWDTNEDRSICLDYQRAEDPWGLKWAEPVRIDTDISGFASLSALAEVQGHPAVAYFHDKQQAIVYRRALDAAGTQWGEPRTLVTGVNIFGGGPCELQVIDGLPMLAAARGDALVFVRALDPLGADWAAPLTVSEGGFVGWPCSLADVDGRPAILFGTPWTANYVRAYNSLGTSWPAPVTLISDIENTPMTCRLLDSADGPFIAYGCYSAYALDRAGTEWGPPNRHYVWQFDAQESSMAVVNGLPLQLLSGTHSTYVVRALDPQGRGWGAPGWIFDWGGKADLVALPGGGFGAFQNNRYVGVY
jgi:PKD repeat protein